MRFIFAHNFYQQTGGEDKAVFAEINMLKSRGHDVYFWSVNNKDISSGLSSKIKTAINTNYSSISKKIVKNIIRDFKPDVVHVHNFFPQISPSIYDTCFDEGIPVVQTLHNYRLICPGAKLLLNGEICEKCISGSPYQAVIHKCYKKSMIGSLIVANMVNVHRHKHTWQNKVNRFITLNNFAKNKFIEAGFPEDKISVKGNFVKNTATDFIEKTGNQEFALFVGRISEEKGIKLLLQAWARLGTNCTLKIVGDGPMFDQLKGYKNVEALGFKNEYEINELMSQALFLIMPSIWYEPFGLVLVEAFSNGLAVIASNIGGMNEIVIHNYNGLLFESGNCNDLLEKIEYIMANKNELTQLGINARECYLEKYTESTNYHQLLDIYRQIVN